MTESGKSSPTIYDIAKRAGVNPSTVSRALSTPGRLNEKTEARIRKAAEELNYQANPFARALPTGKTKMIGLVISDITNPVFFDAVRGAESIASEHGYTLVLAESQESSEVESQVVNRILPAVDGLIMVTTRLSDEDIKKIGQRKPVVLMNRQVSGITNVVPEIQPGISDALDHLHDFGHKHLAYLGGPRNSWMSNRRWSLLMKGAVKRGMTIVEIGPNAPTLEGGRQTVERILASGATAIIAYNDLMAIGVLRALKEREVNVPNDLSLVGFDNIFGSDFTSPSITTVAMPLSSVGDEAVRALLSLFDEGGMDPYLGSALETRLLIRGSTGECKS
jgi:LacI family transcriptional regulator